MSAVVVVGSANIDFTVQVDRAPEQGETIFGRDLLVSFGGKGANQAVAARRAGADVMFIGKVGQDRHGEEIRKNLETVGIDGAGLISDAACGTGVAFILVDPSGGNQIVVVPGCNYRLTPEELEPGSAPRGGDPARTVGNPARNGPLGPSTSEREEDADHPESRAGHPSSS